MASHRPTGATPEAGRAAGPLPPAGAARYPRREIVDAVLYQTRNGCVWRALPHDLPPYRIVFHYFRAWQTDGTWARLHDRLRADVRRSAGRRPRPSAAILDSQSVRRPPGTGCGEKKSSAASDSWRLTPSASSGR